uniref:Proteasome alpha-type subunits domain-containing protein n=1 Tax=Peromyscus maniculatus bairdii TaxID=230844 RepID=A0A8C8ULV9_PERMB
MRSVEMGYDLLAFTFYPNGRVFQVEYDMNAVFLVATGAVPLAKIGKLQRQK